MLDIAVVDDEKAIREELCGWIRRQEPEAQVEAYAAGEELLGSGRRFDIVFLDIEMEGANGLETAGSLRARQEETVLVFVTGLKEYVFEALDLYAFHYLLKPLDQGKFSRVLENAVKEAGRKRERRALFLKAKNLTLDQADILYIESRGKKVEIHTSRGSTEIYGVMDELETQLGEAFYRCHRGYLVNMAHITEYGSGGIILTGGHRVYPAKKKYGEFVKAYMWYLQNGGVPGV